MTASVVAFAMLFSIARAWRWRLLVAVPLIAVGIWQGKVAGEAINADGISYLDLARQYAAGDWSALSNGYWSPAYPLLLAIAFRLTSWTGLSELAVAYSVNVLLLAAAIGAFALLLRALSANDASETDSPRRFGDVWSRAAAWSVAGWALVRLGSVGIVTPDVLVAGLMFAASALLIHRARRELHVRETVVFGAVLGVAYLAKAIMFPVALVLLLAFVRLTRHPKSTRSPLREFGIAALPFAVIAVPMIVVQSLAAGRLTFGETGRLNYAWFVNGAEAKVADVADATRRTKSIVAMTSVPGAKLFADTATGTFPPWYDPARWNAGVEPQLDVESQLGALRTNTRWLRMVVGIPALIVLLFIALSFEARRRAWLTGWPILLAPVATVGLYALVHVEGRLVGAAIAVALVGALAIWDARGDHAQSRSREFLYGALVVFCVFDTGWQLIRGPRTGASRNATRVASAVRAAGLKPGDAIAVIGNALDQGSYWAHLSRVQIVATIPVAAEAALTPAVMSALTDEVCRAGRDLRAVVGRGEAWQRAGSPRALDDGWFVWLNPTRRSCRR